MAWPPSPNAPEVIADAAGGIARAPRVSRRAALALAGGLAGVIGLGWLVDTLAQVPLAGPLPRDLVRQVGAYQARLTLAPDNPVAGRSVSLTATITSASGAPPAAARVTMGLAMVAMDMSTPPLPALGLGGGRYVASVTPPMSGAWSVELVLAIPGRTTASAVFPLSVR